MGQGCVCSCALLRSARNVLVPDAAFLIGMGLASRYSAGCRWPALGGVFTDIGQTPATVRSTSVIAS